jgi:hypothetical protein
MDASPGHMMGDVERAFEGLYILQRLALPMQITSMICKEHGEARYGADPAFRYIDVVEVNMTDIVFRTHRVNAISHVSVR